MMDNFKLNKEADIGMYPLPWFKHWQIFFHFLWDYLICLIFNLWFKYDIQMHQFLKLNFWIPDTSFTTNLLNHFKHVAFLCKIRIG